MSTTTVDSPSESETSAKESPDAPAVDAPVADEPRRVSVSIRSVAVTAIIALLAVTCAVFAWLYLDAQREISGAERRATAETRATTVASSYAVAAATTDYNDLDAWFVALKQNTTPALAAKFDTSAPQLKEILVPLAWKSTATPLAATVVSEKDGVYLVNTFVNVSSTSKQAPDGATTTVTYSVSVDSKNDWEIVDVGGMDGVLPK